jgi:transcriptional regulator with XRE-family HTH domain
MKNNDFSHRLAMAMERSFCTQANLAQSLGVSQPTVSRWLNGSVPRTLHLERLNKKLGLKSGWLFRDPKIIRVEEMEAVA